MAQSRDSFKVPSSNSSKPRALGTSLWQESCSNGAWLVDLASRGGHQHAGGCTVSLSHTRHPSKLEELVHTSMCGLPHCASLSVSPHGGSLLCWKSLSLTGCSFY